MSGQVPYVSQSVGMTAADTQQIGTDQTVVASTTSLTDINNVVRVAASLTGASITGDGAVSGKLTVGSGATGMVVRDYTAGGNFALYSAGVTPSNLNYSLASGTFTRLNSTSASILMVNNAAILDATSTGVAVTGTLSSTGDITTPNLISAGVSGTAGFAALTPGSAGRTGYVTFTPASGARQGYIGFSSTAAAQDLGTLNYVGGAHSFTGGVAVTGSVSATTTIRTGGYTVATLPVGVSGDRAHVTDALAPAFGAAVVGGGAVVIPVIKNATIWVVG